MKTEDILNIHNINDHKNGNHEDTIDQSLKSENKEEEITLFNNFFFYASIYFMKLILRLVNNVIFEGEQRLPSLRVISYHYSNFFFLKAKQTD